MLDFFAFLASATNFSLFLIEMISLSDLNLLLSPDSGEHFPRMDVLLASRGLVYFIGVLLVSRPSLSTVFGGVRLGLRQEVWH